MTGTDRAPSRFAHAVDSKGKLTGPLPAQNPINTCLCTYTYIYTSHTDTFTHTWQPCSLSWESLTGLLWVAEMVEGVEETEKVVKDRELS